MSIFNKNYALLMIAICMAMLSLPAQAWRGGGSGVAYGSRGGAAAWNHGAGVARGPNGGTVAWNNRGGGYHGGGYYGGGYRAPVAYGYRGGYYNNGYSGGQVAGAAVAGLAVGAMAGTAIANSNNNQYSNTTVIVQQPVMAIGTNLNYLPSGCVNTYINGIQYFQCSSGWMRSYGNYYQVVPRPY
jgi:hypothetical protein